MIMEVAAVASVPMRFRRAIAITLAAGPLAVLGGCGIPGLGGTPGRAGQATPSQRNAGRAAQAGTAQAGSALTAEAATITGRMSLPEQVGQLLVAAVPGTTAAAGGAALVRAYHLGGVVYFGNNIASAAQVAALSNGLQRAASSQHPAVPLLIGTDQEGASVARLNGVATEFPDQMAAGATRDPALVYAEEKDSAAEMRALGINLDYAPVADVNTDPANPVIGIRSFGSDPALVASLTAAAVAGLQAGGVAATAKHFPGHGDTATNSQFALPVIHRSLREWWRIDAVPFQAAIRAGVDEIMVGHIAMPALAHSDLPASLSHRVVTGYLRDRLGFPGVITTDALNMGAVLDGRTTGQVAVEAVQAGCDQLLMPASLPGAYQALLAAVRQGRISRARVAASVTRIIALKLARGLFGQRPVSAVSAARHENTPADRAAARAIASRSVTLVRNRVTTGHRRALPLAGRPVYVTGPAAAALAADLARAGARLAPGPAQAAEVIVTTDGAVFDPPQRSLVAGLAASGLPLVVVAVGVPYDLGLFPQAAAAVAAYSAAPVSLRAVAAVLAGRESPAGRLPVPVPGPASYPYGTGLRY
jgi:beta-N-acetylhexosaminidase